ncbi:hypothetical protein [Hartmannibacter diazotrophicus]|uniref:hypothetical protein n=1 Tax=Hartmannibacter diazotrophicus TaxID=1482074 RepID=UPI0012FD776F|nr:hypothetical protein [Hartmannibacter diazotrophicus]
MRYPQSAGLVMDEEQLVERPGEHLAIRRHGGGGNLKGDPAPPRQIGQIDYQPRAVR